MAVRGEKALGQEGLSGSSATDALYVMKKHTLETLQTNASTLTTCDLELNRVSSILDLRGIKQNRAKVQSK